MMMKYSSSSTLLLTVAIATVVLFAASCGGPSDQPPTTDARVSPELRVDGGCPAGYKLDIASGKCLPTDGFLPSDTKPAPDTDLTDPCEGYMWLHGKTWGCSIGNLSFDCTFAVAKVEGRCSIDCPGHFGDFVDKFKVVPSPPEVTYITSGGNRVCKPK